MPKLQRLNWITPERHRSWFSIVTPEYERASGVKSQWILIIHAPLARYVKLRAAHAYVYAGIVSPPPRASDPGMHHGTCVTHVPWCMLGSLTTGFIWSRWRGKRSRRSRCLCNRQVHVSSKRSMGDHSTNLLWFMMTSWHGNGRQ